MPDYHQCCCRKPDDKSELHCKWIGGVQDATGEDGEHRGGVLYNIADSDTSEESKHRDHPLLCSQGPLEGDLQGQGCTDQPAHYPGVEGQIRRTIDADSNPHTDARTDRESQVEDAEERQAAQGFVYSSTHGRLQTNTFDLMFVFGTVAFGRAGSLSCWAVN